MKQQLAMARARQSNHCGATGQGARQAHSEGALEELALAEQTSASELENAAGAGIASTPDRERADLWI